MAREEGTEAAALPKLLLDLIEQVEGSKTSEKRADGENGIEGEAEKKEDDLQQEDIAHNLPKVTIKDLFYIIISIFLNQEIYNYRYFVSGMACSVGIAELSRRRCFVRFRGIFFGPQHLLQVCRYTDWSQIGDLSQQNVHSSEGIDIREETFGEGDEPNETIERPFGMQTWRAGEK